jgi:hypothetical protein
MSLREHIQSEDIRQNLQIIRQNVTSDKWQKHTERMTDNRMTKRKLQTGKKEEGLDARRRDGLIKNNSNGGGKGHRCLIHGIMITMMIK